MEQCKAKTKDKKQCQNSALAGKKYCYIHYRKRLQWRLIFLASIALGTLALVANVTGILSFLGFSFPVVPTLMAFPKASPNQTLIIVASFEDRSEGRYRGIDPAQYIFEKLQSEVQNDKLDIHIERLRQIVDDNSAKSTGMTYGASLVLWGWYDALTITPRMERILTQNEHFLSEEVQHLNIVTPEKLEFSVITDLPNQVAYLALFTIGLDKFTHDKFDDAIPYFDSALNTIRPREENSTNPSESYYFLATIYAYKGDNDQAIANYTKAIQLKPDFAMTYYNRGVVYGSNGEYDLAFEDYTQAIQLMPDINQAYNNRGVLFDNRGDFDNAISDFTKAITIYPDFDEAYSNRGKVYDEKGNYTQAIADLTSAIQIAPDVSYYFINRGVIYIHKGDINLAIADFNKAIELQPKSSNAYNYRGAAYQYMGDSEKAELDFTKAIDLNPFNAQAYYSLAILYASKGEFDKAIANLKVSIKLNPSFSAYKIQGRVYIDLENYDLALEDLNQAILINQSDAETFFYRGYVYLQKDDYDNAIADLTMAIKLNPKEGLYYLDRGDAYQLEGETEKAIDDYKSVLDLTNDPDYLQSARDKLKGLGVK